MPTLQQLLTDIDLRMPNSFTQANKIDWLNEVQREVFRELGIQDILEFDTVANMPFYDLTDLAQNIEFEMIKSLTVDNTNYDPADLNQEAKYNIFYKVLDYNNSETPKIGIYPTPTKSDLKIRIFYERRPTLLTASALTAVPDLKEDYQSILKYGVWIIIAESMDDITKANNYTLKYNAELKRIKQEKYEKMAKYPCTIDVIPKKNYTYRRRVVDTYHV